MYIRMFTCIYTYMYIYVYVSRNVIISVYICLDLYCHSMVQESLRIHAQKLPNHRLDSYIFVYMYIFIYMKITYMYIFKYVNK